MITLPGQSMTFELQTTISGVKQLCHQMLCNFFSVLNGHEICVCSYRLKLKFSYSYDINGIIMFSGTAQTLGTGRHQVGGHHGDQEEGGGRHLWGQTGR